MFGFDAAGLIPLASLAIPIVAIIGGITAGIVRSVMRQRAWELVQRERIAAIERGIDPEKLGTMAAPDSFGGGSLYSNPRYEAHRLRQGLFIGGLVTLFVGVALAIFLDGVSGEGQVWMVGLLPASVGLALLIAAAFSKPFEDTPRMPPQNMH